jgi:hypothetical protein
MERVKVRKCLGANIVVLHYSPTREPVYATGKCYQAKKYGQGTDIRALKMAV